MHAVCARKRAAARPLSLAGEGQAPCARLTARGCASRALGELPAGRTCDRRGGQHEPARAGAAAGAPSHW